MALCDGHVKYFQSIDDLNQSGHCPCDTIVSGILLNARSLRNKLDDIQSITALTGHVDIVAITESWLYQQEVHLFNLTNYNAHHSVRNTDCCEPSRGGGAVLFIRNDWSSVIMSNIQKRHNIIHLKMSKYSLVVHVPG